MEDLTSLLTLPREQPTGRSVPLWPGTVPGCADDFKPWLDPYLVKSDLPLGAVLICPGGGYGSRMPHEGYMIAERFNQLGLHAFVVHYRVAPHRHPEPLMDLSRAIRLVRSRAAEWGVRSDKLAVCGFSAGGHLAASIGLMWNRYTFAAEDNLHAIPNRPDAIIPCYPVIRPCKHGPDGSYVNLLGDRINDPAERSEMTLHLQVTEQAVPAFIWQTSADSPQNALLLASAYAEKDLPFELHIYMGGQHGLAVTEDPRISTWLPLCTRWLRDMGWF